MTNVKHITIHDFDNALLKYDGLSIVECVNENNALLKTMESVLLKLEKSIPIQMRHLRIDPHENPLIIQKFYVMQEPSYLIFYNGTFVDRIDGIVSFNDFLVKIQHHLKSLKFIPLE